MKVLMKVSQLMPDRTAYKKYSVMYQPAELYVNVEIPAGLSESQDGKIVLFEEGLVWLVGHLADLVDKVDDLYAKSLQKKQ